MAGELKPYGFNPYNEARRIEQLSRTVGVSELTANVGTFFNHGLADTLVSKKYTLAVSADGTQRPVLSSGELGIPIETDMAQRGGLALMGMREVYKTIHNHPTNTITLQYSPIGPSSFEGSVRSTDYEGGYYHEGQLYVYKKDGDRVDATAVTVKNEIAILEVMKHFGLMPPLETSQFEEQFITHYTLNPVSTNMTLADFTNQLRTMKYGQMMIHADRHGNTYSLSDVADNIDAAFNGTLTSQGEALAHELVDRFVFQKGTTRFNEQQIRELYLTGIVEYGQRYKWSEVDITTACGGGIHSMDSLIRALAGEVVKGALLTPASSLLRAMGSELNMGHDVRKTTCPMCKTEVFFSASDVLAEHYLQCDNCGNATDCVEPIIEYSRAA